MDVLLPWQALIVFIEPHFPKTSKRVVIRHSHL
jgi:hypothetical protein